MLRSVEAVERPESHIPGTPDPPRTLRTLFSGIRHPRLIFFFVLTSALISLGSGAVTPILNVVFHQGDIHASEGEIGVMFAVAELGLAMATLGVPLLAMRMMKVDAVAVTRIMSLPFIIAMGLLPLAFDEGALLLIIVGASYVGRITVFGVGYPLDEAFNMEVLDPRERATNTGIEIAAAGAMSAIAIVVGAWLVSNGDYATPFLIMAGGILVSTLIYRSVFRPVELSALTQRAVADLPKATPSLRASQA